jgi:hypothetical protein
MKSWSMTLVLTVVPLRTNLRNDIVQNLRKLVLKAIK